MRTESLDIVPLWGLFLIGNAVLWLVMEITGYRIGKWRHAHMPDERDQPVSAMVTSILGLLKVSQQSMLDLQRSTQPVPSPTGN